MGSFKEWLLEVAVKKMGPSAVRGAILGVSGWLIAKQGLLSAYGVLSDSTAHTTTIYWDKLNMALVLALPAGLGAVIKMLNHQGNEIISKSADPK